MSLAVEQYYVLHDLYRTYLSPPMLILHPFGVEEEYFVQLFLEIEEQSSKVPTVSDLLTKMFTEQQINFNKVTSLLHSKCIANCMFALSCT